MNQIMPTSMARSLALVNRVPIIRHPGPFLPGGYQSSMIPASAGILGLINRRLLTSTHQ
jgi:hypothetical protein